jgi:hypothetical protein
MPSEDEIRRCQSEHPISAELKAMLQSIPQVKFGPAAARRRLIEDFQKEWMQTPPEPDKDYPYVKDTAP